MRIAIWLIAAIVCYYVGGMNLAISLSRTLYHEDIRERGSGNPGFTNFKRVYGNRFAWFVFAFDLLKGAVLALVFGWLIEKQGFDRQLGVAFAGTFAMLGHSFPAQCHFKGGKGFLVLLSVLWVLDWRVGLLATTVMVILLLATKYMSLSTICALLLGAICLFCLGGSLYAAGLYAACVAFMIWRHRENIRRLRAGTESKFSFHTER